MSSYYHLKRMDRAGMRPAGHPVTCTCDACWAMADAVYNTMVERNKAKKKRYDQRRKHERRVASHARYRVVFFFGRLEVGSERFRAVNVSAAIEIANYLYGGVSDVSRSYRLYGPRGQLLLIYERPPATSLAITEQAQREAVYTEERLAASRQAVARSRRLLERVSHLRLVG